MHLFKKLALDTIVQQKIRRKAKRALMISRTKEAILAADKIRIRYIPDRVMAIPKSAQLHSIKSIVAGHMVFPIDREKEYFRDKFLDSPLLNDIMIDMFWYCTAAFFQPGVNVDAERGFYDRVARHFTAFFVNSQMKARGRIENMVIERLPDAIAQVLFIALHDGFPNSGALMTDSLKREIIQLCFQWFVGLVPLDIRWDHWVPESSYRTLQTSTTAISNFPALKNRMNRIERLEKMRKAEGRKHNEGLQKDAQERKSSTLYGTNNTEPLSQSRYERSMYSLNHSPLIGQFLNTHNISKDSRHLQLFLRLTKAKDQHLDQQKALQLEKGTVFRRNRRLEPQVYTSLLNSIKAQHDTTIACHQDMKSAIHQNANREMAQILKAKKQTQQYRNATIKSSTKVHQLSNVLVCQHRMQTLHKPHPPRK